MNSWRKLIEGDAEMDAVEHFRVVSRHGEDLLVLPADKALAVEGLSIYPAQTNFAKIARRGLGIALKLNLSFGQNRICLPVNRRGWLGELLGHSSFAILCGNPSAKGRRFVFLGFENGRPSTITKVGLGEHADRLIAREAAFLREASGFPAVPRVRRELHADQLRAFSMDFIPGSSPQNARGVFATLLAWIRPEKVRLESLPGWANVANATNRESLHLAGKAEISPVLYHGDFAPWNIREHNGKWTVIDWERGEIRGIPSWDWFHYIIQTEVLVRRRAPHEVLKTVMQTIALPDFQSYAARAGFAGKEVPLLEGYLHHAVYVNRQTEGADALKQMLAIVSV